MRKNQDTVENEEDYVAYLNAERKLFAWCLEKYGQHSATKAEDEALSFYPYEPTSDSHRGLVFHDEAWHWAMLKVHGAMYWKEHPELQSPSEDYKRESKKLHNQSAHGTR
jgi:hypothetical protein